MEKYKYEKPVGRDLNTVLPVQGSCNSGNGYTPGYVGNCDPGGTATPSCSGGSAVLPATFCNPSGSSAGVACWNGSNAG